MKNRSKPFLISIFCFFFTLVTLFSTSENKAYAFALWHPSSIPHNAFWRTLRASFQLDHYTNHQQVYRQIRWFQAHPHYLNKLLTHASPYLYYIYSQVHRRHLPGELVLLPIIESAYDPFAYSDRGAAGLWQLMPGTATGYGIKQDWWYDGRRDVYASTDVALDYLTYLVNFFNGNWLYAIGAYDAGEGTVQEAIERNAHHFRSTRFWNLPLPRETDAYVPRLLALAAIISHPQQYGIHLPYIKNGPYFAAVNIGSQIDLAHAAKLANISLKQLYELNPGFNRWATDPNGPFRLLLPIDKIATFNQNLAKLPTSKRVTWHRYRVRRGDSLNRIAHRFRTRVPLLQEINKINNTLIRPGQIILIPRHTKSLVHYDFSTELDYANHRQLKLGPKKYQVTVHPGDSLWKIAHGYGLKISQIRFWNHLNAKEPLKAGQKLTLWVQQHTHVPHSIRNKHVDLWRHYKVHNGDTLNRIAQRFGVNVKDLKTINRKNSNVIRVGERLNIPSSNKIVTNSQHHNLHKKPSQISKPLRVNPASILQYTVKPGDSLNDIAKRFHVKPQDLQKWNKHKLGVSLQVGQVLVVHPKERSAKQRS